MQEYIQRKTFLWKAGELGWQLLPNADCDQDKQLSSVKSVGGVRAIFIAQQDGSRLKVIRSSLPAIDIIARLGDMGIGGGDIYTQSGRSLDSITDAWLEEGGKDYEYIGVWMHTFLNGARVIPLLVNTKIGMFYDASSLFPGRGAADDMGVIVDVNAEGPLLSDLFIEKLEIVPRIVSYRCSMRMCHCCGMVSDISKPRVGPWIHVVSVEGTKGVVARRAARYEEGSDYQNLARRTPRKVKKGLKASEGS